MRQQANPPAASLWRRLAAISYDALLLFSVLFCATWVLVLLHGGAGFGPGDPLHLLYQITLWLLASVYFLWPWTHGGQTLGMRCWRLRLVGRDGDAVGWGRAGLRLLLVPVSLLPLGLGYLWALFDREGLAWHDRLSATRLIVAT